MNRATETEDRDDRSIDKEAERGPQMSERRFRDFAEVSSDWFWETDENHVYTWVSGGLQRVIGVAPEWFVGKRLAEIADPSVSRQTLEEHRQRLTAHQPYRDFELRVNTPAGAHWVRSNGVPVFGDDGSFRGYRGTGTDITAQVAAEEKSRQALALFSGAIESIADGFALFDADDCFVTCNEMYQALVAEAAAIVRPGVPFETFIRRAIEVGELPDALDDPEAWLARRMEQHRNPKGPIEVKRKNLWLRIHERRMPDGGTVIVLTDITREKQREEQLRQTQKMDAIGKLTGGVAHDFNNLLSVISGNIELLKDALGSRPDLQAMAESANRACERGATLTRSLLAFARQQPLLPTDVDIDRLVADMFELIRRTIPANISVHVIAGEGLWHCKADVGQLQNVLLNLVINARDAMPGGGALTIETAATQIDDDYAAQHGDVEPGDYVMLAVSDTGTGMPSDVLARAFEPFFTRKPVGKGTGLGLSMVYGFAKQSGGHAAIYSEVGLGTTVRVFLPRLPQVVAGAAPAPSPIELAPDSEMILVVDDDPDMLALVCTQLKSLGYRVVQASDGNSALDALGRHADVGLLLTDVVLAGGMGGGELARRALAIQPGLGVMLMSGYTGDSALQNGLLKVATQMLHKPFTRVQLGAAIKEVLGKAAAS